MHLEIPENLIPITIEQYKKRKLKEQLSRIVDSRNSNIPVLINEYKKFKLTKFDRQFLLIQEGIMLSAENINLKKSISVFENALKITKPNFCITQKLSDSELFSSTELAILNNIAHSQYYIFDLDNSNIYYKDQALNIMWFLKRYYENNILNFKDNLLYSIILFNLSNWLGLNGNFNESLELSKLGYEIENNSLDYKNRHLFNIAYNLASLGNLESATNLFKKAFALIALTDEINEIPELKKELYNLFKIKI